MTFANGIFPASSMKVICFLLIAVYWAEAFIQKGAVVPNARHSLNSKEIQTQPFSRSLYLFGSSGQDTAEPNEFDKIRPNLSIPQPDKKRSKKKSPIPELEREKVKVKNPGYIGDEPQTISAVDKKEYSIEDILNELQAITEEGPRKYCILGTRHCSFLHQQMIEMLAYALVLSNNMVYTSGAEGTNAAAIRGALRAEKPYLLEVRLPQSITKQPKSVQELLKGVTNLIEMPENDDLSLSAASRICNSMLISKCDQLVSFAFHDSSTVIEAINEAKGLKKVVVVLFLD